MVQARKARVRKRMVGRMGVKVEGRRARMEEARVVMAMVCLGIGRRRGVGPAMSS